MKKTNRTNRIKTACVLGLASLLISSSTYASNYLTGGVSDLLYYKIGGGSVMGPNYTSKMPYSLGLGVKWNSNLMCGNFDIKSTVANQLNGVTEGFNNMMSEVVSNAQGAVASLPALIIQRANPQLYDLLTNGVLQGKLDYSGIKMSCKQMANKMADYADSSGFTQAAKAENFTNLLSQSVDAIRIDKLLEEEGGDLGSTWIGGIKKGGIDQEPIKITSDVVLAGYNTLINRNVTDTSSVTDPQNKGAIYQAWQAPSDAQAWIIDVIGEREMVVSSSANGNNSGKAGRGLNPITQNYYESNYEKLVDLINDTTEINDSSLTSLNKGPLNVTRGVIETLREDSERGVLANRLASEMALAQAIDEALMARRVLLAGRKEPNIAKNQQAQAKILSQIAELDMEINQVKLEYDMRKSISGNTLSVIHERKLEREKGVIVPSTNTNFDPNK
ncbi:integrating conjugative element protein [Orbus wheelerorum]|uniref:integrating conjugative element protein n=1 Tax=Orbus wheelerorum TaxID=3074111 RepID=UPI00370D6C88